MMIDTVIRRLEHILATVDSIVWGWTLIFLVLTTGLWLSIRTGFVQIRFLKKSMKFAFQNSGQGAGEISSFSALCTTLSATIGTGNIVGVATAITIGGPGAILWMQIAAFLGMATKYAEGVLAVKFRKRTAAGRYLGGPFMYIEQGLGSRWRWLAKVFAICGVLAGLFGIGTITQANSIASALEGYFDPARSAVAFSKSGNEYTWTTVIGGLLVTLLAIGVLLGGARRISAVSQVVVPLMSVTYIFLCLVIILSHVSDLPSVFLEILRCAFIPSSAIGALGGITIKSAIQTGVSRGIFSNEAGLGSAPIAAAAAKCNEPAQQGLASMAATVIDTCVICTATGLAILLTDAWKQPGLEGVAVTDYAWKNGLSICSSQISSFLLMICLVFFAFTTIIGWNFYAERCLDYLCNGSTRAIRLFRIGYIIAVALGPYMSISAVWHTANIFNGLMAFPNLFALMALSGVVAKETRNYITKASNSSRINKNH